MKQELKLAFSGQNWWLAFGVMLICFFGMSVPEWVISVDWGDEFRASALQLSVMGIFFGGAMLLMPFCACLPHVTSQVDDIVYGFMDLKLIRSSLKKVAVRKVAAVMISGGAAVALAFLFHAIIWNLIAIPCDPSLHPYHEIPFGTDCVYGPWYTVAKGLPLYVWLTATIFFCSAIWAYIGLAVSVWYPDRIMAIVIPACIYSLLGAHVVDYIFGINTIHPATLFNDALTMKEIEWSLIQHAIILGITTLLYWFGLKRRAKHV